MTSDEIRKHLEISIVTVRKDIHRSQLKDEATFSEDLGFDSMGLVALASEMEKRFGRSLPLAQWLESRRNQALSLGSLIQFLEDALK
ncbi:MAG: acyl carrier protein [Deltaproteobacteria bacterium]|nr:acyl carrier protein [Deltaproteobacteria bacterium]